ncbi:tetratricopeptide repeat protein [Allobaculum mucilyticum]|uniref:tetratricopeptide repeat protein n=1 Tax=Allobaculum mucilyticum TaxID=2834459 RepID=UPI001E3AAC9A|nr:hypothetical protein [Allobaculum mucilyticum]UNT97066.1 SEL1-like repeat protein [Allobaculum mucilyticum]
MKMAVLRQLEAQASTGDGKACLALYEEYNNRPEQDYARRWLDRALACDEPHAQFIEGVKSLIDGDTRCGIQFLKLAAENRSNEAKYVLSQYYLGNVRSICPPDELDTEQGLEYLFEAAQGGYVDAQILLGKMYCSGKWVGHSQFLARYWLETAVRQNSRQAQLLLDQIDLVHNGLN